MTEQVFQISGESEIFDYDKEKTVIHLEKMLDMKLYKNSFQVE